MQTPVVHPHKPAADLSGFYVITPISNPARYESRYRLYWRFKDMCDSAGVKVITVEQAFGDRPFMVTEPGNPLHVQIRSVEELWLKENMINIGVKRASTLDPCKFPAVREVAWVDADVRPARPPVDWFEETWHQLQHYEFVQMFETMADLDRNFNQIGAAQNGFMANYIKHGTPPLKEVAALKARKAAHPYGSSVFGRPGLAWAANVDALNKVGGLIDFSILGAADWYMAHGLIGSMSAVASDFHTSAYERKLFQWQELAERWIKRDVGYVAGLVYHDFHGKKKLRGYESRGAILRHNQYSPDTDIKYDQYGQLQLETWEPRQIKLRDQIRQYFRSRDEDSTEL
jgi:hypothetical protein